MMNPYSDPGRQLGKFIAALTRQWKEELGSPEARATEAVLRKAHQLLSDVNSTQGTGARLLPRLPAEWLDNNPWASPHIQRIDRILEEPLPVDSRPATNSLSST